VDDERVSLPRRLARRAQLARVAAVRARLVRPLDGRQGSVAGRRPLRVLLIGSGPVVGWGVGSHDLALPGAVARSLAAAPHRGAGVEVVAQTAGGGGRV
jgi:hypothetical protein